MSHNIPPYKPVEGRTYTLFGNSDSTDSYYHIISKLADTITKLQPDLPGLITEIRHFSGKKDALKRSLRRESSANRAATILRMIDPLLREYTWNTEKHLKTLPLSKLWDRRLATTREQYHLYMIEVELTNRLYKDKFLRADRKIALMPYCLRDFSIDCKTVKAGFDYQCMKCSGQCFQNHASRILKEKKIEPYIWREGDMKKLAKFTMNENKSFGVLGIACLPELVWGMRNCCKNNIPVTGIPLNANCCVRWFGEFFPNSVDLRELERLVS